MRKLFSLGFEGVNSDALSQNDQETKDVIMKLPKIDTHIKTHASRYPIDKIAKVDLAILRLAIYELLVERKNPPKVIIDEAVILAKEYGNEKSYSFVNGVLGNVLKQM